MCNQYSKNKKSNKYSDVHLKKTRLGYGYLLSYNLYSTLDICILEKNPKEDKWIKALNINNYVVHSKTHHKWRDRLCGISLINFF